MKRSIILIPTSKNADVKLNAVNLNSFLKENSLPSHLLQAFDLNYIEETLALNNTDDLLESIIKQYEEIKSTANDAVIIQGVDLNKPYAEKLNLLIATALDAAVIFVTEGEEKQDAFLRQTKIMAVPYKTRYKKTLLGFIAKKENASTEKELGLKFLGEPGEGIDLTTIKVFLDKPFIQPITPPFFKYRLIEKARKANKKIVLPEGEDPRTFKAANICADRNIAQCILLGEKDKIKKTAEEEGIELNEKIEIIDPKDIREKYVAPLIEARKAKGMTEKKAREQLEDNVMLGTLMLQLDEVDGLVSGAVHTTANTIRPAFQIIKTPPNVKLVSSVFFMCLPDQVVIYGDCAINPNPNAGELADIAIQGAQSAEAFGLNNPKIAMLSYSTGVSGKGPDVDRVREATEIVKKLRPDLAVDGPMQYDAAVSEKTAKIKLPESKVAGNANVFVMPSLSAGNIAYKTVQRSTDIVCIGPMLQGLRKPVNDLSRGCTVDDIVFTIAVTAIQAISS